ncbi:MAG: hypothetical protein ACR2RL_01405, partial [Gammaproteobacteria bacterium]
AGTAIEDELRCWMWQAKASLSGVAPNIEANGTDPAFVDITLTWVDREPREFADGVRLPKDEAECEAKNGRQWESGRCLVAQVWTIRP